MQNAPSGGGPLGWLQDIWRRNHTDAVPPSQSSIAHQLKVQTEVYLLYHPDKLPMLASRLRAAAYSSDETSGFLRSPWLMGALEKLPSAQDLQARLTSLQSLSTTAAQDSGSSSNRQSNGTISSNSSGSSKLSSFSSSLVVSGKPSTSSGTTRRGGVDDSYDPDDDESWDEGDEADAQDEAFQLCKGKLEMTELMHEVLWVTTNKRLGVIRGQGSRTRGTASRAKVPLLMRSSGSSLQRQGGKGPVDGGLSLSLGTRRGLRGVLHWALPLDGLDGEELAGGKVSDVQ